jgi:outer membrane protein assembly factor BamC
VNHLRSLLLLLLAALAVGCSPGLDRRYLDAELNKPLDMPPDLSQPETQSSFDLPTAFSGDGTPGSSGIPVLPGIESVELQGTTGFYWLSAEIPVDELYRQAKNFWAAEGYSLVMDEPAIGIMQTEWIYTEEGAERKSDSWFKNLFSTEDLSATQDQFRTRIERGESGTNRVYITHRGTEYVHEISVGNRADEQGAPNEWQYRRSDPQLEVEMLSRLMIYLGLQQNAVDAQLAKTKLFKPRASLQLDADEKSPFLLIRDPYPIAWNRLRHALEVLNFEILVAEYKEFSGEGVFVVKARVVEGEADTGLFSFGTSEEVKTRKFTLVLSEESHEATRLIIEDQKGNFDTTPAGAEFVSLLFEQIK